MAIGGTTKSGLPSAATLVYEMKWARLQDTGAWLIEAPGVEFSWQSRCALRAGLRASMRRRVTSTRRRIRLSTGPFTQAAVMYAMHPSSLASAQGQVHLGHRYALSRLARLERTNVPLSAFLDAWSALRPHEEASVRGLAGVLQYGPSDRDIDHALLLDSDTSRHCCRIDKIELLWRGQRTTFDLTIDSLTQFTIRLELLLDYDADPLLVEVPVTNDRMDLARAVLPRSLTLRR